MRRYISICLVVLAGCATATPHEPRMPAGDDQLALTLPSFPGPGDANLGALHGKVVLVDFWATWCGPCHDASQRYQQLYDRFHAQGLEVYGVSLDEDTREIPQFTKDLGITYPILLDPSAAVSGPKFGLQSIPAAVLADRHGKIRFGHAGAAEGDFADLEREIQLLLAEP